MEDKIINVLLSAINNVRKLHRPINGPYDDLACKHCTDLFAPPITSVNDLLKEPVYIEYPCPTIKALDEE